MADELDAAAHGAISTVATSDGVVSGSNFIQFQVHWAVTMTAELILLRLAGNADLQKGERDNFDHAIFRFEFGRAIVDHSFHLGHFPDAAREDDDDEPPSGAIRYHFLAHTTCARCRAAIYAKLKASGAATVPARGSRLRRPGGVPGLCRQGRRQPLHMVEVWSDLGRPCTRATLCQLGLRVALGRTGDECPRSCPGQLNAITATGVQAVAID
ncbi:hypothetical protein FB451DRAFT_1188623 [Mycena latifolia]|nr:hypothetical protein FB451DRAFT_1188623 [Mycena latifolia]